MEHYTARHGGDSVDGILEWPWKRFEVFYEKFIERELIERLENRRDQMISAIWSNSVYDEHEQADRTKVIEEIDRKFDEAVQFLRGEVVVDQEEIDYQNNPFFAKAKEGLDKKVPPRTDDPSLTANQLTEDEREVMEMLRTLDQT